MTQREEKPTISQLYKIGDFIDARDNQGDWRVGYIVQKNDIIKTFKIRFDGWPAKYDQIFRFGTPKLQQFRSQVLGYTGQKQYPALRQGWKYSQPEHQDKMRQLFAFEFGKNEQKIKSVRQLNQWLRGHNYFYVDFLTTLTYQSLQQIKIVLEFFKLNLNLCINYLKYITENFQTFIEHLDLNNNQHLENISVAKSFSFYEIFDTVFLITGSYPRQAAFFKDNEQLLREKLALVGNGNVKSAYQIKMVDFFFKNGGFQAIDNVLTLIKKHNRSIRFMFLNSLAHLYTGLSSVIQVKSKQIVLKNLKLITQKNIEFLGDKQMKDLHHHQVVELISEIVQISKKTSIEADIQNWGKVVQMEIYFKMITCSFFEKKLRGITSLHEFIERKVQLHKERQTLDLIADGTLSKWIQQKKLFDILFANDNPELIKKSTELIKYLYQRDNKMQKYIEMIWKYREGKHETALKEIYNFIAQIPTYDRNQQFTIKLFKKHISQVDQNLWDPEYVKMIKDYTVSALFVITGQNVKETFGFDILYKYAQKNASDQTILGYFIEICRKLAGTTFMQKFIIECFKFVEKNNNASFHVSLLVRLLRQKMVETRSINLDGTSIIIQNIILCKNMQKQNLDEKFELLATYLKKGEQVIAAETFIQFWNQMIDSKGRISFFRWFYKTRHSGQIYIPTYINQQTKCFLIENFWTDEYLIKHPLDQYEAILLLEVFKLVNKVQQKIMRDGLVIEVMNDNLTGLEKLHSAYRLTKNPKTSEVLAKGLAQIYTSGSTILQEVEIDLVQIFTQRIFEQTQNYSKKNDLQGIKKMIRLLEEIINRDQEIYDVQQNIRIEQMKSYQVKNIQNNDQRFFRINNVANVYSFKKLIAEKYGIPIQKFDMIINDDQVVRYRSYFRSIGEAEIKGKILIKPKELENSSTKNQINHHLEMLFELMDNKEIQERVWNIVSKLPISNEIRSKLIQSQNQLKILENTSFYKELYMFKVALSLQKKWWNIQSQEMVNFFLYRLQNTPISTQIEREYVMVSAKLLQKVLQLDEVSDSKFFSDTFFSLFEVAKRILVQTNNIENLNTLYIKKFVESFFTIGDLLNKYLEKKGLKQTEPDALSLMLRDQNIENLLKLCLIQYRHEQIRKEFPIRLVKLATVNRQRYAHRLASIILNDLLDCTVSTGTKNFKQFNSFFCYILQTMGDHLKKFYAQHKGVFFNKLCKLIQNQAPQQNSDVTNNALHSYLSLIRYVIQEVPENDLLKFFAYIYKECLFKGKLSKCKSKETRTSIFSYFIKLMKYKKNTNQIFAQFGLLHVNGLWRTRKLEDWTIAHSDRLKSSTGYTGLRNLGCICYMNSFFQQIFMIEEFKRALLISQDPSYDPITVDDNVLYQIKKMFMNLMLSDRKAYNPKSFCMSFKDYEGNPTNVNEQMDIDEFSGILLDRLQNSLKGTKYPNLIKDTFGGVFSNEIICKGCPHFSQTEESFLSLALTVKDKKSIHESLQTMIKGDTLDGDNAYYCERCAKKVSAVKRVCLKTLPNYLMVALKRFEFDFNTMQKLKINQYCEFPTELNLQEYSYEYLRKKDNPKFQSEEMRSDKYYEYKLKGVVVHIGYADSGHYYSLIQQRSGHQRWLEFNDTIVRKFNVSNLNDEAFGGQTGGLDSKEKIKNAYLLIYERVEKINSIKEEVINLGNSFINMEMYSQVISTIQKENFQYNIENILFSNEYVRFITNMIEEAGRNKETTLNLQKFIIIAFLTTTMRSKTDPTSFEIIQKIWNSFGKGNIKINSWVIQQFSDPKIYDELFRNCPIREIKRNLVSWTILMLKDLTDNGLKIKFFKTILSKITTENENNAEGLTILHSFVDEDQCLNFFVQNHIVGRIHQNIIRRDPRLFGSVQKLLPEANDTISEFGYEQIIEKTAFELKKSKYDNEQGIVWALLYKIISSFKKSDLPNHLHPKEIQYLTMTKQAVYRILGELKSKFDIDVFTNYVSYLSQGDYEFSQMLAEMVEKGLKEFQSKRYRQFFELFKKIIAIEDDFSDERSTWIFNVIRSLKQNEKYAMDCTIIQLWLCKIVNDNQKLATYLMVQRNITQYLSSLPLKKVPSEELSKKNVNFSDATINKYHGIPFPTSRRGYMKLLKHVEDFYEKLLKGVYEPIHFFESGNHVAYDKLGVGEKVAFFDQKDKVDFEEATIKQIFLDKLCIARKSLPNRLFWIWNDDERLTSNLNVIKDQNSHQLDSSKTTEMQDQIDFEAVN